MAFVDPASGEIAGRGQIGKLSRVHEVRYADGKEYFTAEGYQQKFPI